MANVQKTIEIIFAGTDKVSGTITAVGTGVEDLGSSLETIGEPFANVTKGILAMDAALAALAVGGLVYAFNKSKEFGGALIELKKVTDNNAVSVDKARANAESLSDVYGESATEILQSSADYIQAGFIVEEAMLLTKNSMDLVVAGGLDAAQSSEILIATLKGFDAPASDAARVVDVLNAVSNKYATNVEELGIGMSKISPIAKAMGFSFEETAGILTPVIEVFRSGSEASNALRTGLLKLIDDSKPVQEALNRLGVSQRDANGQLKSGKDILLEVSEAFKTAEQSDKLFLTAQLVGTEQSAKMVTVFDNLSKSTEITAVAMQAFGSASSEVALRLESSEVAVKRMESNFNLLAIAIGDKVSPAFVDVINGVTNIEKALKAEIDAGTFDPLLTIVNTLASDLGVLFEGIAKALPKALEGLDFSVVLGSIDVLKKAVSNLFGGVDLTNPEELSDVLQTVTDTIANLISLTGGIIDVFTPMIELAGDAVKSFNELDVGTKDLIGQVLGLGTVLATVGGTLAASGVFLKGVGNLVGLFGASGPLFKGVAAIGEGFTKLTAAAATLAGPAGLLAVAAGAGAIVGSIARLIPGVDEASQGFFEWTDDLLNWSGTKGVESVTERTSELRMETYRLNQQLKDKSGIDESTSSLSEFEKTLAAVQAIPTIDLTVSANADTESAVTAKEKIFEIIPGQGIVILQSDVDDASFDEAKKEIEEKIPPEKLLEIQAKIDVANIEAQAAIVQTAIEWTAQLNIAEVEANAQKVEAIMGGIEATMQSSADIISSAFGALTGETGLERLHIEDTIKKELELRERALQIQEDLAQAEIDYLDAKAKRALAGNALIQVEAAGLTPALEMIWQQIIEYSQVRATEEGLALLL